MFRRINQIIIVAIVSLVASTPAVAFGMQIVDSPGQPQTAGPVPSAPVTIAQQQKLDQLQGRVAQRFASEGGWHLTGASTAGSSASPGFQWGDAGIGAAGAVALLGIGALPFAAGRRRRAHRAAVS